MLPQVIVIDDSDGDGDGDCDGDADERKPAALTVVRGVPCISLLETSDEDRDERPSRARRRKRPADEDADHALAEELQRSEWRAARRAAARGRREEKEMAKHAQGKAVLAVREIIALVAKAKRRFVAPYTMSYEVEAVTTDDMVFFAKNMLDLQEEFLRQQVNGYIDVGYHYTNSMNMANIRTHGLMTAAERQTSHVRAVPKGAVFGDGIYTANNGTVFRHFGEVGLIVGRLQGKVVRAPGYLRDPQTVDANTVIGDKRTAGRWPADDSGHEIVLRSSGQCLPAIKFDAAIRNTREGKECIRYIKAKLQHIFDRFFNEGLRRVDLLKTPMLNPQSTAPGIALAGAGIPPMPPPLMSFNPFAPAAATALSARFNPFAPAAATAVPFQAFLSPQGGAAPRRASVPPIRTLTYTAPKRLHEGVPPDAITKPAPMCDMTEECVVCFDPLESRTCVALRACQHVFHRRCLRRVFAAKPQCPVCRVAIGEPQGKSPSGQMAISTSPTRCAGYGVDSITINYSIPSARQLPYHDNPGQYHAGKHATAYLPNNAEGRGLCRRLQFAFAHGLTFTVGTSMTTNQPNQCTWASIHHKTSPFGGASCHGFPDSSYFENCHGELDALSVPSAESLDDNGNAL